MTTLGNNSNHPLRAIIHIDMDAFYAQVEQVRLGLPASVPLCVQQWNGLIAVSYAARAFGITRMMTPEEALQKCPDALKKTSKIPFTYHINMSETDLKLVHVATLATGDTSGPKVHTNINYKTHKVSLDAYRRASIKVMDIIKQSSVGAVFQRCSIDEAFLDVTGLVMKKIESDGLFVDSSDPDSGLGPIVKWDADTHHIGNRVEQSRGLNDLMLFVAAEIAQRVRCAIFDQLGYTSSAGIAHNKMLSKLVSAMNKPNKQTVLRTANVSEFMKTIKLTKIRGLGGKLGHDVVEAYDVTMASDLLDRSQFELESRFGPKNGAMLYHACRGECFDPVQECPLIKTIGATKSLQPEITSEAEARKWIMTLSAELHARVHDEDVLTNRWPRRLELYSRGPSGIASRRPSYCVFPPRSIASIETISAKAWSLFCAEPTRFPCRGLYMAAIDLVAVSGEAELAAQMAKWLQSRHASHDGQQTYQNDLQPSAMQDNIIDSDYNGINPSHQVEYGQWDDDGRIQCPVCKQSVLPDTESQMEHSDFHFAQQLSRSLNGNASAQRIAVTPQNKPANKTNKKTNKRGKRNPPASAINQSARIESFFSSTRESIASEQNDAHHTPPSNVHTSV